MFRCEWTEEIAVPCAILDVELVQGGCAGEDPGKVCAGGGGMVCPVGGVDVCEGGDVLLDLLTGCYTGQVDVEREEKRLYLTELPRQSATPFKTVLELTNSVNFSNTSFPQSTCTFTHPPRIITSFAPANAFKYAKTTLKLSSPTPSATFSTNRGDSFVGLTCAIVVLLDGRISPPDFSVSPTISRTMRSSARSHRIPWKT